MVNGLDRFKEHFAAFSDRYVLIGGTASSLSVKELGGEFRVTKDLDIVLCVEVLDGEFVKAFWAFIKEGRYENRQKSSGKRLFYRFYDPKVKGFPEMLELFARVPDALDMPSGAALTPIPVEEDVSSLSAILLDNDYYEFVMQRRTTIDGVSVLNAEGLIPLKARAYLDLSNRKAAGQQVDSKQIRKHKNDIFRLFAVLDREVRHILVATLKTDLELALLRIASDPPDLKSLGITSMTLSQVLDNLRRIYNLSSNTDSVS